MRKKIHKRINNNNSRICLTETAGQKPFICLSHQFQFMSLPLKCAFHLNLKSFLVVLFCFVFFSFFYLNHSWRAVFTFNVNIIRCSSFLLFVYPIRFVPNRINIPNHIKRDNIRTETIFHMTNAIIITINFSMKLFIFRCLTLLTCHMFYVIYIYLHKCFISFGSSFVKTKRL